MVDPVPSDERRVFDDIHYSYSGAGTFSGGTLSIVSEDGEVYKEDVPGKGQYRARYRRGHYENEGNTTVAFLEAAGANVAAKLNATIR